MKVLGIIPARYASVRFPGKPLADIAGKTMIRRVYEQAIQAEQLSKLVVATDNQEIFSEVKSFGGNVMITNESCKNGTERCADLLSQLDESFDAIINIQGDEPLLNPNQINQLIGLLEGSNEIATLGHVLLESEKQNRNIVKVGLDKSGIALGFSRDYDFIINVSDRIFKHVGLYGFKSQILNKVVKLQPSPNELFEKLEQLRWIDHGYQIKVGITDYNNLSVDIPEDIDKIISELKSK